MKSRRQTSTPRKDAHHAIFGVMSSAGAGSKPNEDACDAFSIRCGSHELYAAIVADGVTSTGGGALAARLAVASVRQVLTSSLAGLDEAPSHVEVKRVIDDAVAYAEYRIKTNAQSDPSHQDMSTTLVVALVVGHILYIAHAGDSRAYLCRHHKIYQLTIDHSYVEELVRDGELNRKEAEQDPRRNAISRYLGPDLDIDVDHMILMPGSDHSHEQFADFVETQAGDIVLVCTDGLTKKVSDTDIHSVVVQNSSDMQRCVSALISLAVQQRRERDNVTVVLIKIPNTSRPRRKRVAAVPAILFMSLLSILAVILTVTLTSTRAIQEPADAVILKDRRVSEIPAASTAMTNPIGVQASNMSTRRAPHATAPTVIGLPTATATLVLLPTPVKAPTRLAVTPVPRAAAERLAIQQSLPISKSAIVGVSVSRGQGIEVIVDSLVLSDEVGGGKIDICLEVLDKKDEGAGDTGCRNLWDAFSVTDDDLKDIGCSRLSAVYQVACTVSGADLAKEQAAGPLTWTNAVLYIYALRADCDGLECRDRILASQELSNFGNP